MQAGPHLAHLCSLLVKAPGALSHVALHLACSVYNVVRHALSCGRRSDSAVGGHGGQSRLGVQMQLSVFAALKVGPTWSALLTMTFLNFKF